ncbi:MAG: hypothetical protein RIM99_10065 [Cyclobacteriaceae bacterium]
MCKSKIFIFLIFGLTAVSLNLSYAQISVIQDGDGETSIQILTINQIVFNAADEAISFTISPSIFSNQNRGYWLIQSTANANKGSSSIFNKGEFNYSGKAGFNYVYDHSNYPGPGSTTSPNLKYSFIGLDIIYSRHSVLDTVQVFKDQLTDDTNLGVQLKFGYNWQNRIIDLPVLRWLGELSIGLSGSVGAKDNTGIIDAVEVTTIDTTWVNGTKSRSIGSTKDVYLLHELDDNITFSRWNFDIGKRFFNQRLLLNLHGTFATDEGKSVVFNPAIGLFLLEDGAPLEAVVGLQLQYKDWSGNRIEPGTTSTRWDRSAIVLTAGFPF